MENRINSHVLEDQGINIFENIVIEKLNNNVQFTRKNGREYGIDGEIELFDNGKVTGQIAKIQIKSKKEKIIPLKKESNLISYNKISKSNYEYAICDNILIILVYVSIEDKCFYYLDMNKYAKENKIKKQQNYYTVHIPTKQNSINNFNGFIKIIKDYWNK